MIIVINLITWFSDMRIPIIFIIIGIVAIPLFANASLGDDVTSVTADQIHMKGSLRTTSNEAYTVHEIISQNGTKVREYVTPTGKIFAITWKGQFIPDLRQLLGKYFDQFSKESISRNKKSPRIRGPIFILQPGLVVQSSGHMRAYSGRAYLPDMVPQGIKIEDIQ